MSARVLKLSVVGTCYICGKPISSNELFAEMEDSDSIYCEKCWDEYLSRCEQLIEVMRKEKQSSTTTL